MFHVWNVPFKTPWFNSITAFSNCYKESFRSPNPQPIQKIHNLFKRSSLSGQWYIIRHPSLQFNLGLGWQFFFISGTVGVISWETHGDAYVYCLISFVPAGSYIIPKHVQFLFSKKALLLYKCWRRCMLDCHRFLAISLSSGLESDVYCPC